MQFKDHYDIFLGRHAIWQRPDYESHSVLCREMFMSLGLIPNPDGGVKPLAVDIGAGSGFQSVSLAELGYVVVALDLNKSLIFALRQCSRGRDISFVERDILDFADVCFSAPALVVCLGNTAAHCKDRDEVRKFFDLVRNTLAPNGFFLLSFCDLTDPKNGLDRIHTLVNTDDKIVTCFVEYFDEMVVVNDLVYERKSDGSGFNINNSWYEKVRLTQGWVQSTLIETGFTITKILTPSDMGHCGCALENEKDGMVTILAQVKN
ncbi:MAG: class I SAM-dependent methyltransferase [Desulfovibrio sp.]